MPKKRCRVVLDFPSLDSAVEWFKEARRVGALPEGSALYREDGLDERGDSGVTKANRFIVRKAGVRPKVALVTK